MHGGFSFAACGALGESLLFPDEVEENTSSKAESLPPLSWRGDPRVNKSDWTIVVTTNEHESQTYHVHKSVLSVGPRSSKYFSKLFLAKDHHRNPSKTTKIELDEQDADSFPLLLDFVYNTEKEETIDEDTLSSLSLNVGDDFGTTNAISLRHLARVFDCEGLMSAVNKFIQKDLSLKTGPLYLAQAYLYQDDRLVESAKRLCVDNFTRLDSRAVTKLPLTLFQSLITSVAGRRSEDESVLSCHLSDVVCQYFERNPKSLTVKLLLELTDVSIMPKIASEPAIGFTALARELSPRDFSADSMEWKGLVALCDRCAKAVVAEYGWKDFNVASALEEYLLGPCAQEEGSKIDSLLFATSFAAALEKAQRDYKLINEKGSSKKQVNRMEQENSELQKANRSMKEEVERYKHAMADTKEELLRLKQQVKHLRRNQKT